MSQELSNTWYIASKDNRSGFTSNPENAVKDLTGAPIIAPGHLIKFQKDLVRRARAKIKEAKRDAWQEAYEQAAEDHWNRGCFDRENPYAEKGSV